jgi:hypothetical protein
MISGAFPESIRWRGTPGPPWHDSKVAGEVLGGYGDFIEVV